MRTEMFENSPTGVLVPLSGVDPTRGPWTHSAFLPHPLPDIEPTLSGATFRAVANARAALAALDATARSLPNPQLFRQTTLRIEAQSTAALEGTYEPLERVLGAGDDQHSASMREVLNYLDVADAAFEWVTAGADLTVSRLAELNGRLLSGTSGEVGAGQVRTTQVAIGRRADASPSDLRIHAAQFVPPPPGPDLEARLADVLRWLSKPPSDIDPVVAAAMAHYAFEALHPFTDGNGRLGRLLIVVQLLQTRVLSEPSLSVSPWFEARRADYFDNLMAVSTIGDWDSLVSFFARGMAESADDARSRMGHLALVQATLKDAVAESGLRSGSARQLVDYAVGHPTFTVSDVAAALAMSYSGASRVVESLVNLGILATFGNSEYKRRFHAPAVLDVLLQRSRGAM